MMRNAKEKECQHTFRKPAKGNDRPALLKGLHHQPSLFVPHVCPP